MKKSATTASSTCSRPLATFTIRRLTADDSTSELTDLLHRAYAKLAAAGMRYLASHQTPDVTASRIVGATTVVAFNEDDKLVGTISIAHPDSPNPYLDFYDRIGNSHFFMFGIDPDYQGSGLGTQLMKCVEQIAVELGADEIACDTSEHAHRLSDWYARLGYTRVGTVDWDIVNYRSVLLAKPL
jgi:ribosomal protein S18 acetylase RimI-like enzyme